MSADELLSALGEAAGEEGALVVIRRGPDGASATLGGPAKLYAGAPGGAPAGAVHVPAFGGTAVRDVTGCGNAFCGGFLAGLAGVPGLHGAPGIPGPGGRAEALRYALAWGHVSASFMAEAEGVPGRRPEEYWEDALARFGALAGAGGGTGLP